MRALPQTAARSAPSPPSLCLPATHSTGPSKFVVRGGGAVALPVGNTPKYSAFTGFAHLAAGLACGLSGMAAGIAIGIVGDAGVRASAQQSKLYVGMVLILIFAEALGLYGLIVGLILTAKTSECSA